MHIVKYHLNIYKNTSYLSCDTPETPRWREASSTDYPDSQNAAASPQTTDKHTHQEFSPLIDSFLACLNLTFPVCFIDILIPISPLPSRNL